MNPSTRVKEKLIGEDQIGDDHDEAALLVAALAATLVAYRRHVRLAASGPRSEGSGRNWRTMARLQQLRG
jgi:hypothetical protein